jgi:uncharacterized membrane protein YraQ (UPF0718 family)
MAGSYTLRIIEDFFDLYFQIAPYLVVSIVINIITMRYFRGAKIRFSHKSEFVSIVSAALIGVASPLPTYAAIPIGLSFFSAGIPFSAVIAFILSSPLMNPTIFFLTATQISMEMAIARTVSAFLLAVVGGVLASRVFTRLYSGGTAPIFKEREASVSLGKEIYQNARYIVKYFSIAILISAAVKALIPPEFIERLLAGDAKTSTIVAIGMGIPFYTCGGSAIPLMSTLQEAGMSKRAMLAFFIAGPATKLETLYAFKTMLGVKVLVYYVVLTLVFAYGISIIYSFLP